MLFLSDIEVPTDIGVMSHQRKRAATGPSATNPGPTLDDFIRYYSSNRTQVLYRIAWNGSGFTPCER